MSVRPSLLDAARDRVIIFDGAMGTAIQARDLSLDDYGGKENCVDILCFTRPDVVREIHAAYFAAGADIIETNSFGANRVVLTEFDIPERAYELNVAAAKLAVGVAQDFSTAARPRWVSGSMGPGTKLPTLGHIRYDDLVESYAQQAQGLVDGGVDVLQIETCQDLLQCKAAIAGALLGCKRAGRKPPIIAQVTIESFGTMLVGTEIGAALVALDPLEIDVIGINCATGPNEMNEHVRYLGQHSRRPISVLPNAGLPRVENDLMVYDLTPEQLVKAQRIFVEEYGVQFVGGCCGTTYEHIKALSDALGNHPVAPRQTELEPSCASLFQPVPFAQETSFLVVGERLNANGSKQFRQLMLAEDRDGIQAMMKSQVREGAHVLDLCIDYVGRDGAKDMDEIAFNLADKCTLPLMIDSTEAPVLEAALKRLGGRAIINSINLEDGEAKIDRVLPIAKAHGSALVALCIDEDGQARTRDWKVRVAKRIHAIATEKWGLSSGDLIFDTLTMPIATGQEEVRHDGVETLEAIKQIKRELPGVFTILGVSNISFGLKPAARQVLNSVFLHYAVEAGLDMAIVNPQKIVPLHKIEPRQREVARRIVFDERDEGMDPLEEFIKLFEEEGDRPDRSNTASLPVEERLKNRIIDGERKNIERDLEEALLTREPLAVINEVLLDGMKTVGELFASGEMQLPFVLQSAETMKTAVAYLEPKMEKADQGGRGTIVIGTVRGDVHDIGKNLVDIILSNNGYTVHNIGIKQPLQSFIEKADAVNADAIGMSGLLVKSTVIMKENLLELNERGLSKYPVLLGGAALTRGYVEKDLRALYNGLVFYGQDAFEGLRAMDAIARGEGHALAPPTPAAETEGEDGYQRVQTLDEDHDQKLARAKQFIAPRSVRVDVPLPALPFYGPRVARGIPLNDIFGFLNEVALFRGQWGFKNSRNLPADEYEAFLESEARPRLRRLESIVREQKLLVPQVVYGYWPCQSQGNDLIVYGEDGRCEVARFTFPRQVTGKHLCLADFFRPVESGELDVIAFQLVTVGAKISAFTSRLKDEGKYEDYALLHGLSVESTEALAEFWHKRVREELGIGVRDAKTVRELFRPGGYEGQRFSFGYAACPAREDDAVIARLLGAEKIGVALTDEYMWEPEQTTSALICHHPEARYFNAL
jgi:5-methyltetrahydrofolate--homocysteine methyltransferase